MENARLLTNWSFRQSVVSVDPYMAPEHVKIYLNGDVYGHPNFADATNITTSSIVSVDSETGTVTTKSGSRYVLGSVDVEYEKIYPGAFQRLMKYGKV